MGGGRQRGGHGMGRLHYPFRKMKKKNSTHSKIKFYIIFIEIFFFYNGYKKFAKVEGEADVRLSTQKNEKITRTSTHSKIKFCIIFS